MEDLKKSFLIHGNSIVGFGDKNFSTAPIGVIQAFSGQTAPHGYLLCDGASYKVADYPHLYAVIGNTYGGDSTNFNVPDYRETVLVGVGENTTDTITDHDVYGLGEFKDDQLQGHWHNLGSSDGNVTISLGAGTTGGSVKSAMSDASSMRYPVNTALDAITDGTNGEPRKGTTTHGKQKGVTYIIKAFHTNEGVDSGVSDDVVEYVDNKVASEMLKNISASTTLTFSEYYARIYPSLFGLSKFSEGSIIQVTTGNYQEYVFVQAINADTATLRAWYAKDTTSPMLLVNAKSISATLTYIGK